MKTMRQDIDLATAHQFPDMTALPVRLHKRFWIETFVNMEADGDWAVSDSINVHRIWEPVETAVLSSAFAGNPGAVFLDFGAHVGWYSVIARTWGLPVLAWDAADGCVELLEKRKDDDLAINHAWIDETFSMRLQAAAGEELPTFILKADIEGAEIYVVRGMSEMFSARQIAIALIECSPVFNNSYPHLINALIAAGYEAYVLPEKRTPPPVMDDTRRWLREDCRALHAVSQRLRDRWVNDQHQFNAVFCTREALWG